MAENKRYYWLKIPENFFDDDTIQFIESQENGAEYLLFYLKICCKATKAGGKLIRLVGNTLLPYDAKSLAKATNTSIDTVKKAMELFYRHGILSVLDTGEIYIEQMEELIGSETEKARYRREARAKQKLAEGNNVPQMFPDDGNNVPQVFSECSPILELEKELELDKELELEKERERKKKKKARRFKPPTLQEVEAYCQEKGLCINPEMFVDYYEGNGWKVGKNPMKSWQATLRNWNRRELKDSRRQSPDQIAGGYFELLTEEERNGQSGNG